MSNKVLLSAIRAHLDPELLLDAEGYGLSVKITRSGKALFSSSTVHRLIAFVILKTDEIPFQDIADAIIDWVSGKTGSAVKRISCDWVVCSDRGGIYLYEAIATRDHLSYRNMKNRFLIVNSDSGSVSFGPGDVRNKPVSEEMASLLDRYRTMDGRDWMREMGGLLDTSVSSMAK